jgi:hypothetical protein
MTHLGAFSDRDLDDLATALDCAFGEGAADPDWPIVRALVAELRTRGRGVRLAFGAGVMEPDPEAWRRSYGGTE